MTAHELAAAVNGNNVSLPPSVPKSSPALVLFVENLESSALSCRLPLPPFVKLFFLSLIPKGSENKGPKL